MVSLPGCHCMQAHGVIGNQPGGPLEVEQTPAVSLTLASFAATSVSTFSVTGDVMPDAGAPHPSCTMALLFSTHYTKHMLSNNTCNGRMEMRYSGLWPLVFLEHVMTCHGDHHCGRNDGHHTIYSDASPIEWEGLTGAPLDTEDNLSFVLLAAPTFAGTDDLLQGEAHRPYLRACPWILEATQHSPDKPAWIKHCLWWQSHMQPWPAEPLTGSRLWQVHRQGILCIICSTSC